jgi:hypothetical protein
MLLSRHGTTHCCTATDGFPVNMLPHATVLRGDRVMVLLGVAFLTRGWVQPKDTRNASSGPYTQWA